MRISTSQIYHVATASMSELTSRSAEAQRQIAGGSRIVKASDDPGATTRASELSQMKARTQVFDDNLAELDGRYALADRSLGSVGDALLRIKVSIVQARNGALGGDEREALATAIRQDLDLIQGELRGTDDRGVSTYSQGVDGDHSPLEVRPGLLLGSEIALSSEAQSRLTGLASAGWLSTMAVASDEALAAGLQEVEALGTGVLRARVDTGARWQAVAAQQEVNASLRLVVDAERSRLLDPDVAEVISDFSLVNAQLEAARALFTRIQSGSQFDRLA